MNTNEVLETIKNLNLTFDGKLNSETVTSVVQTIAPYYTWYLVKEFVLSIISMGALCFCVFWIAKSTMSFWKYKDKE